jgi:hypothetical protein
MAISSPPGQPSITETLSSSFRDGFALVKKNAAISGLTLLCAFVAAIAIVDFGGKQNNGTFPVALEAWIAPAYLALVALAYYAVAAAVRTLNPQYRMTAGQFVVFIALSLLVGLLTAIAAFFFIIPAYWVGVKLMLTPYTYIVTDGAPGSLKRTWDMTTGYYWQTVGMLLLSAFCFAVIVYAAFLICAFGGYVAPLSIIVLAPLALAVLIWMTHVHALVLVRWTYGLLPRSGGTQGVPVPA